MNFFYSFNIKFTINFAEMLDCYIGLYYNKNARINKKINSPLFIYEKQLCPKSCFTFLEKFTFSCRKLDRFSLMNYICLCNVLIEGITCINFNIFINY